MTSTLKPFRLITMQEQHNLWKSMQDKLIIFNQDYCSYPLRLTLSLVKPFDITSSIVISKDNNPIGLLEPNYLADFQQHLFGDTHQDFTNICKEIFELLLKNLLNSSSLILDTQPIEKNHWIYPGAPTLKLELQTHNHQITLLLHPNWVLSQLPKATSLNLNSKSKPNFASIVTSLEQSLAKEKVRLAVGLKPQTFTIQQLKSLTVGTLLKTNHLVKESLRVTDDKGTLAVNTAVLGQFNQHKSIIITRKS